MCQPNELKREIKKKTGDPDGGQAKIWGGHDPPRPPLRIATGYVTNVSSMIEMLHELKNSSC